MVRQMNQGWLNADSGEIVPFGGGVSFQLIGPKMYDRAAAHAHIFSGKIYIIEPMI
jgi:hypothetical protein